MRRRSLPACATGIAFTFFAWLLLPGCSGSAPEILYPDTQLYLVRDPESGDVAEVLRFYAAIRDSDGADDPARMFLVHDESELFWELTREQWSAIEYAGDDWYGVPDVRMSDGANLPRGVYRLIAEDSALSRTESTFVISNEPVERDADFPELRIDGSRWEVIASTPVVLRVYGRAGGQLLSSVVSPGAVPVSIVRQVPAESGLVAYVATAGEGVRLESGPYAIAR